MPRLRRVSASWDHVIALTDDPAFAGTRGLIAWGRNEYGHCNIPDFNGPPWYIDGPGNPTSAKVVDLAAGEFINIVLFNNGKVAAWGQHDWGVDPRPEVPSPNPPRSPWYQPYSVIYDRQNDAVNPWRFTAIAAGGHFVAALGFVGRFIPGTNPPEPIEGEVITWGTFDYAADAHFGPNYRKGDVGQPQRPPLPPIQAWEPWSNKECGFGPQVPQTYTPPYRSIGACHQSCWGIKADGAAMHGWGNQAGDALVVPPSAAYIQVTGGYHQWGYGIMLDAGNQLKLVGWGNSDTAVCGTTMSNQLPAGAPTAAVGTYYKLAPGNSNYGVQLGMCHSANCDGSTGSPLLTANDLMCFNNRFGVAQFLPNDQQIIDYANCDGSTGNPALTANDFMCFMHLWASQVATGGCP